EFRRPMRDNFLADIPFAAQRVAHAIGVEHEKLRHANGSRFFVIGVGFGRSMSSFHAPRMARNCGVHSSAGSRTTFLPTRRATTSRSPSGKRHDFGRRMAWL